MADLVIADSDRDALVAAGLVLSTLEDTVTFRVVASLQDATRLLHDARRSYVRVYVCGVSAADSGSLRSVLTVLQARGTRVLWFDSHDFLWTTEVRTQLDQLDVQYRLPEPHRPETERTSGIVLAHLLDSGDPAAMGRERDLRGAVSQARGTELGGPDWIALVDAVEHDHRLVANRAIRAAIQRVWDPGCALSSQEGRLLSLQRSREARLSRFLERLSGEQEYGQELLRFDAEAHRELRYIRPRVYVEAARRRLGAEHAMARVERGWFHAGRDPHRPGLDLPVALMDKLFDLDVAIHGYPYRATVQVQGGADVDQRIWKALEIALEEERSGRRKSAAFPELEDNIDW